MHPSFRSCLLILLLWSPMGSIRGELEVDLPDAAEKNPSVAIAAKNDQKVSQTLQNKNNNADQYSSKQVFEALDVDHDSKLTLKDFYAWDRNHNAEVSNTEFSSFFGGSTSLLSGNKLDKKMAGFTNAFSSSTAMIIATEIGDKTFFIAAVLSMRHSRLAVFSGGVFALICMTVLSTMMGLILPSVMPRQYTHIIGGILFLYFGIKLIYDSRSMSDKVSDELEEVEEELNVHSTNKKSDEGGKGNKNDENESSSSTVAVPMGNASSSSDRNVLFQSFLLTFLAEWGDRSQIATIALAAAKDPYGVTLGACFGHSLCTGMAVIGGRMLASKISEKTVSFWGGVIFLVFALHALFWEE